MTSFKWYVGFALALTFTSACTSALRSPRDNAQAGVISSEEIARSASTNAWDLLRDRARQYEFSEDQYGRPRTVRTRRGRSTISVASADVPLIIVDGARITDLGVLRDLSTASIQSVELLSGIGGTVSQGTNAGAGVIYIHTWEASQN
ncbi:MAG TPA: Plug domain-containing protein [Gemmatimonadaceae bacterium]|nr:Plug domain-containing protein [Gemmatimonadaceae bacterium]